MIFMIFVIFMIN